MRWMDGWMDGCLNKTNILKVFCLLEIDEKQKYIFFVYIFLKKLLVFCVVSFTKICQLTAIFLIIEYVIQYIWKDEYENILHSRIRPTYIFLFKAGNYFVW